MYTRSARSFLAIAALISTALICIATMAAAESAAPASHKPAYTISTVQSALVDKTLTVTIKGESSPAYTVSERFSPFRVVLDIANAVFSPNGDTGKNVEISKNDFAKLSISTVKDQQAEITRFEFTIADSYAYKVNRQENDIVIVVSPAADKTGGKSSGELSAIPVLTDFLIQSSPTQTTITLASTRPIQDFKHDTIGGGKGKPARMFIDIANVNIDRLLREKEVPSSSVAKLRVAQRGPGARVVFDARAEEIFDYAVSSTPQGLQVVVKERKGAPQPASQSTIPLPGKAAGAGAGAEVSDATLDKLIESSSSLLQNTSISGKKGGGKSGGDGLGDAFSVSGYTKEKISVDFYKIDIHNVFRLFREVTNLNIIVDEAVTGTLTLALTDVPWDFALDIILNLMDLSKEQRFNTIVIYPKKKEFVWPERRDDNLSVQADSTVIQEEALVIQQAANQPEEVLQAQELMRKAANAEKNKDYEEAVRHYEAAVALMPRNSNLLNRLTAVYLVNLKVSAKALYFAKENLKANPQDTRAALYAAIAAANMQRTQEASDYFAQSISGKPPMKEALISFAAFTENNQQLEAALTLLEKYAAYYGESLNTMVAKGRIYDKLNKPDQALAQYKSALASGFSIHPDLKKYIQGRIASGK